MNWLNRCHFGDCRAIMRDMIKSGVRVNCIITSPPYFALRDYGVEGQLGLESTVDEYVKNMVEVFSLCRQLLADDGTLWLNLGDSYAHDDKWGGSTGGKHCKDLHGNTSIGRQKTFTGLRTKNLIGSPWRVAFALQAAGWILRQDIIWSKPNPMPESIKDRCTKSHEYIFLLSKSRKYYFDAAAIKEDATTHENRDAGVVRNRTLGYDSKENLNPEAYRKKQHVPSGWDTGKGGHNGLIGRYSGSKKNSFARSTKEGTPPGQQAQHRADRENIDYAGTRNKRSVWTIPTQPYTGAHFATFPEALVEPCILAGSRVGDIIFDPFFGSGTVGQVAQHLGRNWIGCELNRDYEALQAERTAQAGLKLEMA